VTPGSTSTRSAAVTRRAWLAWVVVCVVWGTTYFAIKIALETIPPFLMGGLRYVTAGLLLALVLRLRGRALPATEAWGRLAVLSFFMFAMGNGGVVWAEQSVPSGLTAVLIATSPFWMVAVERLVAGAGATTARQWVGLSIGFAGILLLVWPDITAEGAGGRAFAWGVVAVQIACAGWAIGSSYTRRHVMPGDVLGSAALQMVFGGAIMLALGTALGEWSHLDFSARTTSALVYLTVAGSLVAFAAYSYALRHLDVAVVSLYTYVNPVIAVALGTLLLGEPFGLRTVIAAAVIFLGVVTVGPGLGKR
jgi:drug/metabolite transporter (DMT)-like permease